MSEARERFLREILSRIPVARIGEVHLFPAMRQGGVESAVAVIAAEECEQPIAGDSGARAPHRTAERVTVYSALYRHTLKGMDRGKWEFELVAEADAPLEAVGAVVRGVQKRTGEPADAERLSSGALRAFVEEPWRATTG